MFFENLHLHFNILLIFRGQICFGNPENSSLEPSKCKTSYYYCVAGNIYWENIEKIPLAFFFWEKLPTRTLGNSWKFSHLLSWTLLWYFCQKKIFSFVRAGPFGLYSFQKTSSMNRQTVRLTFPKIYIFRNRNKNKQNSSLNTIYSGKKYLVNHFQYWK